MTNRKIKTPFGYVFFTFFLPVSSEFSVGFFRHLGAVVEYSVTGA